MTSVAIWNVLKYKGWRTGAFLGPAAPLWKALVGAGGLKVKMSLNDVCVFVPAWFGAIASVVLGFMTKEVSGSWLAGGLSALVMAIVPAHLMRSIGGGYDNESVAVTAMCLTFFMWCRSLRTPASWPVGLLAGLAYGYMVASWGGFIFVGNMVAIHAATLVALGYYSSSLHRAYSLWYIVGTACATQVPVVGMSPFRSLEQLGSLAVFLVINFIAATDEYGRRRGLSWSRNFSEMLQLRITSAMGVGTVAVAVLAAVIPTGYFGPLSVRVRSLFIKHTRTGNPLVDSVAEHQPASADAYWHHLHYTVYLAPLGLLILLLSDYKDKARAYSGVQVNKWFLFLYAVVAYYFANKMMRLIILLGPVASALAGIAMAALLEFVWAQVVMVVTTLLDAATPAAKEEAAKPAETAAPAAEESPLTGKAAAMVMAAKAATKAKMPATPDKAAKAATSWPAADPDHVLNRYYILDPLVPIAKVFEHAYATLPIKLLRLTVAAGIVMGAMRYTPVFTSFSDQYARQISHPSLMFKAKLGNGREVMVNDYQEAYWWLRDNTPKDSRVMSWWDYGCVQLLARAAPHRPPADLPSPPPPQLPDRGHRQPHDHCRRQHVESGAHRDAGPHLDLAREARALARAPHRGLCPHLGRLAVGRPRQVAAHGAHRVLRVPGRVPQGPAVQELWLLCGPQAVALHGQLDAFQDALGRQGRRQGGPQAVRGGVHVAVRPRAHLEDS